MRPAFVALIEVTPKWVGKKLGHAAGKFLTGAAQEIPKSGIFGAAEKALSVAKKKAPQVDRIIGQVTRKHGVKGVKTATRNMERVLKPYARDPKFKRKYGPSILQQIAKEFPNSAALKMRT
jgi:hypothetical protein